MPTVYILTAYLIASFNNVWRLDRKDWSLPDWCGAYINAAVQDEVRMTSNGPERQSHYIN
jgi:hypothetical protein